MSHLFPRFNVQGPLTQRPSVGDLSSPVPATCIALPLLLLTAQVPPKRPFLSLVGKKTPLNSIIVDGPLSRNLLRAPLQLQRQLHLFIHLCYHRVVFAAVLRSIRGHITSLLGAVTARASVAAQFPTYV